MQFHLSNQCHELFDSVPGALVIFDSSGRIVRENSQARRMVSSSDCGLDGHMLFEFVSGLDAEGIGEILSCARLRPMTGVECLVTPTDGREFWAELMISPFSLADGYFVASLRNISGQHTTNRAVRMYCRLVEAIPIAVGVVATDRRLEYLNHSAAALLGTKASCGGPLFSVLGPAEDVSALIHSVFDVGEPWHGRMCAVLSEPAQYVTVEAVPCPGSEDGWCVLIFSAGEGERVTDSA